MIAIDKGIPVCTDKRPRQREKWDASVLPFDDMEVGDSFRVSPLPGEQLIVCQNRISGAVAAFRKLAGDDRRFTTRQREGSHVRCWRVQ